MSVASTAIAAIYKHYIGRSRERLRKAAEAARASDRAAAFRSASGPLLVRTPQPGPPPQITPQSGPPPRTSPPMPTRPRYFPPWAPRSTGGSTRTGPTASADRPTRPEPWARPPGWPGLPGPGTPTSPQATPYSHPAAVADPCRTAGTAPVPRRRRARRPLWRRPLALAGIAVGIFLLAMAGLTAIEAVAGKPLDALVGGKHNSGTTIGNLVGGQSSRTTSHHSGHSPVPMPSSTPTPGPSTSPSVSPSPAPSPSPTPTPAGTPTPTTGGTAGATYGRGGAQPRRG